MAIQVTTWVPDTCPYPQCVVEYEWDDTLPADLRVHTLKRVVQKCAVHQALPDAVNYAVVTEENPRKNIALGIMVATETTLATPEGAPDLTKIRWIYDSNRVLQISFAVNLTNQRKTAIQNAINAALGVGKVVVS